MTQELIEIEIPSEYISLAGEWYDGMGDMLYALSSTGDLSLGTIRPLNDDDEPMTDQEWHVHLWSCLSSDVYRAFKSATKGGYDDADTLKEFEEFCDETVESLRQQYGLED